MTGCGGLLPLQQWVLNICPLLGAQELDSDEPGPLRPPQSEGGL